VSKPKDAPSAPPAEIIPPARGRGDKSPKQVPERDPEFEGLMSEIESDLREEELRKIWQRYGKLVIALVVVVMLGVIGVQLWRDHVVNERLALANRYDQAVRTLQAGKADEALATLGELSKKSGEAYAAVAELQRAAVLLQRNDIDGAIAAYKTLSEDSKADSAFRDLATVLRVLHSFDRADPKVLEGLLAPLLNPGNAFHPTALELSALLAAKQGDVARAGKLIDQILADDKMPPAIRARATDLSVYYKSQTAPVPAPAAPKP